MAHNKVGPKWQIQDVSKYRHLNIYMQIYSKYPFVHKKTWLNSINKQAYFSFLSELHYLLLQNLLQQNIRLSLLKQ